QLELGVEPRLARGDLVAGRLVVDAPLAAPGELEVLHRVGHEDVAASDAGGDERVVEHAARRPDERMADAILEIARHFTYEQRARVARPFTEHDLRRFFIERAAVTVNGGVVQRLERAMNRQKPLRTLESSSDRHAISRCTARAGVRRIRLVRMVHYTYV